MRNLNRTFNSKAPMIIGRSFLRVIKHERLYHTFKQRFLKYFANQVQEWQDELDELDETFQRTPLLSDISFIETINNLMNKHIQNINRGGKLTKDNIYQCIVVVINDLLHITVEQPGLNMEAIGKQIFDLTGEGLFGEEFFHDMENVNKKTQHHNNIDSLDNIILMEYKRSRGVFSDNDEEILNSRDYKQFRQHILSLFVKPTF